MPDPKYLLELKSRAERALNADPPDGLTAFTAAWALWEALRRRMLFLACKREGWTVDQAREVLAGQRMDHERFIRLFEAATGGRPWEESLPLAAAKLWPEMVAAVELRERIIHGTTRIGEENLRRTAFNILRFANRLREHQLGDPFRKLPRRTRRSLTDGSLRQRLGLDP